MKVTHPPIHYARDDQRCLITLTITEPYALDEMLRAIDRQAAEDTWTYAVLSDLRAVIDLWTAADLRDIAARVQAAGEERARGPVGIAVGARRDGLRMGLTYAELTRTLVDVEVLLTAVQLDDWIARHAPQRNADA